MLCVVMPNGDVTLEMMLKKWAKIQCVPETKGVEKGKNDLYCVWRFVSPSFGLFPDNQKLPTGRNLYFVIIWDFCNLPAGFLERSSSSSK